MSPPCLLLPHGVYSLLPALLTNMGWIAALFKSSCNYALLSGEIVKDISVAEPPYLEVGLQAYRAPVFNTAAHQWEFSSSASCVAYPDTVQIDLSWKFANAFSFLALVLGGGATFYLWISSCCRFSRGSWRWAGYEVAAACLFQTLSFVWFRTGICREYDCELYHGSKASIMAAVFWLVASLLIFGRYPAPKELIEGDGLIITSNGSRRSHGSRGSSASSLSSRRQSQEESTEFSMSETSGLPPVRPKHIVLVRQDEEMAAGEDSQQDGIQDLN